MKKQQLIYERIDQLFYNIFSLKNSKEFKKFLQFLQRMPGHAPFNTALVYAQNPNCFYYATAKQWRKRFRREIRNNARPLIILFPFGPVDFVYDYEDTFGEEIVKEDILNWWGENTGEFDERILENTIRMCSKNDLYHRVVEGSKYLRADLFSPLGYAAFDRAGKREIVLNNRYNDKDLMIEEYGVLCHEIAHHLLGHLGGREADRKKGWVKISDRSNLEEKIEELEAELAAWIVFDAWGIEKRSARYMASWVFDEKDRAGMNMSVVFKTANIIKSWAGVK